MTEEMFYKVANTLMACGVEPRQDMKDHELNVSALCDLLMLVQYGEKEPRPTDMTLAGAIRQITEEYDLRIDSGLNAEEQKIWRFTAVERIGGELSPDGTPRMPRTVGLAVKAGDVPENVTRSTILDFHFVKAVNAIRRQIDGETSPDLVASDVPADDDSQDPVMGLDG